MLELLWWLKTLAIMDVWTIEHVLSGLSVWHSVRKNNHKVFKKKLWLEECAIMTRHFDIIGVLFLAYLWETIEHYLETGVAGKAVEYWFQGVEYWPNRIIFDPLALVIGYLIAKKISGTRYPRTNLFSHLALCPYFHPPPFDVFTGNVLRKFMKLIQKAVIKQGEKYLIGLRSEKAKYFPLHWDFPGGKLEPGEEPIEGIAREVKEETNLDVKPQEVIGVYRFDIDGIGEETHQFTIYSTEILGWTLQLSDEHLEHRWATKEEIMKLPIEPYFAPFFERHS